MSDQKFSRRGFISTVSTGLAAVGLPSLAAASPADAKPAATAMNKPDSPDAWFNQLKGKHRIVYDVTEPNGIMPFAWPRVFLLTNEATGSPAADCGVVVVLRHEAMPFALNSALWEKYKFGEMIKFDDPATGKPATRNPFWQPGPNDFSVPGVGPVQIGIDQLQESGVMFCACHMAMTVMSAVVAQQLERKPADVLKEWEAGVLPGIEVVPSGVWAVGRAQEHHCAYCYAG
jgi:intracellular sulfur oxidation DsrE/DsrF family protein